MSDRHSPQGPSSLPPDPSAPGPRTPIIGTSAEMTHAVELARRAARGIAKVLITGESGTGKELFAREVHDHSRRAFAPLVTVNCAGLSETLLESELFGHEKGSFTGAFRDKPGKIELAHGGTLFLDEVGEMSLHMQAMLLRFLENGEVQRVGSAEHQRVVDTRVICATNRNLAERVAAGAFREDLLYRLRVIHIYVPPLRDRPGDVAVLVHYFASRRDPAVRFDDAAMAVLQRYRWPGNVRELQNVVEEAAWQSDDHEVGVEHLPAAIRLAESGAVETRERRRQVADELFDALSQGRCGFWTDIHPLFLSRDITRHDIRELLRLGLQASHGSYRGLMPIFRMDTRDYQRFHNFLAAHDCKIEYRSYRTGSRDASVRRSVSELSPLIVRQPGAVKIAG